MIETFRTGSAPSVSIPTIAWPPSWYAVRRRSAAVIITCRSAPSTIRSSASVKSDSPTTSWFRRAASSAASLTRFARSAPTMPGVVEAILPRSTSGPSGTLRVCTSRIACRPARPTGARPGEQRLARAREAGEQHAVGDATAELAVLLGVAQEVDDLGQLRLRLVDPRDVRERDAVAGRLVPACTRAAERAEDVLHVARSPHQPEEQQDEEDRRPEAEQQVLPPRRCRVQRLGIHGHTLPLEQLREGVVIGEGRN